ncbi:NADH-quinone oxidoreductase subunit K [Wenzhouxiangella sp. AB-CW3]|uniref:NADH-quinone oxidoreductase subunit K n=1 Tax=Wenzhouxiangella sp. AB-CW3 TaxID=2771012 RepID=UPI00168BF352|nr:NADH-quinone oxidoreductase subunit K [Wenzhouxiangella sp. AB-CW3]QOC23728.1 NADH-quinone oxidoreductase subunit K [Wenzhouxiangella sp. AB-CW3]
MTAILFVLAASLVFGIGVWGLLIAEHLLRKLLALNVMSSSVFIIMLVVSGGGNDGPDPVAQALILTGIVIAVAATAFALALMISIYRVTGRATISEDDDDGR